MVPFDQAPGNRPGGQDILSAYHDRTTLGPTALRILAKKTGLRREDL